MKRRIFRVEERFINNLMTHLDVVFLVCVSIVAILIRIVNFDKTSYDMVTFLVPWSEELKSNGGIRALALEIGNYNTPYLFILALLTYLPINPLYAIKSVSVLFDFALAMTSAYLVYQYSARNKKGKSIAIYTVVLFSLTVILNSSYWGQCDSIYVEFLLLCLLFLMSRRYFLSFVLFGISFSFKLQAVFFLPVLLLVYFIEKRFTVLYFLYTPITSLILSIPALLMGRSLKSILSIYEGQVSDSSFMTLNYPNLYYIFGGAEKYIELHLLAIFLTIALLGIGGYIIIKRVKTLNITNALQITIWILWICVLFLPAMHERYAYALDIFCILLAIISSKRYYLPLICNFVSLCPYSFCLLGYMPVDIKVLSIVNLLTFTYYSYECIMKIDKDVSVIEGGRS